MTHIELMACVGPDGILTLSVPMGIDEANNREVKVVVARVDAALKPAEPSARDESEQTVGQAAARNGDGEGSRPGESEGRERAPSQEYPIADWTEPTEYDWDEDYSVVDQAVRRYLEESHADR
jgi:hypothetical protein